MPAPALKHLGRSALGLLTLAVANGCATPEEVGSTPAGGRAGSRAGAPPGGSGASGKAPSSAGSTFAGASNTQAGTSAGGTLGVGGTPGPAGTKSEGGAALGGSSGGAVASTAGASGAGGATGGRNAAGSSGASSAGMAGATVGGTAGASGSVGVAGSATGSGGAGACEWTRATCNDCQKACPTNDGGYCRTACGAVVSCIQAAPNCGTPVDPMCVLRTGAQSTPNECTVQWERAGGGATTPPATSPAFVARAFFECACGVTVPGKGTGSAGAASGAAGGKS